jgi:hypothetical protein
LHWTTWRMQWKTSKRCVNWSLRTKMHVINMRLP